MTLYLAGGVFIQHDIPVVHNIPHLSQGDIGELNAFLICNNRGCVASVAELPGMVPGSISHVGHAEVVVLRGVGPQSQNDVSTFIVNRDQVRKRGAAKGRKNRTDVFAHAFSVRHVGVGSVRVPVNVVPLLILVVHQQVILAITVYIHELHRVQLIVGALRMLKPEVLGSVLCTACGCKHPAICLTGVQIQFCDGLPTVLINAKHVRQAILVEIKEAVQGQLVVLS